MSNHHRVLSLLLLVAGIVAAAPPVAQPEKIDSIDPFLMDRDKEIALARSAAPGDIGANASVWVLTRYGYAEVAAGSNGFACFVGRGWSGPLIIGSGENRRVHPEAFDPDVLAPHCFNAPAAASVLPLYEARTRALLDGLDAEAVEARVREMLASGELTSPAPGSMAYMMSPGQDLGAAFASWRPHVMVYLPNLSNADWGITGFTHDFPFIAESGTPWSVAVLPMRVFSDGTQAPEKVAGRSH